MKRILVYILLFVFQLGFSQEVPKVLKTKFSKEALAQKVQDENGKETSIKDILQKHKGKVVVLDFWAGWCRDCLKAFPKANFLKFPGKAMALLIQKNIATNKRSAILSYIAVLTETLPVLASKLLPRGGSL